ncbi:helix-turn-helix transcriptional regulator [Brevundimonas sp.]|uniref:AraC family transcriptional regulator n=1 Tax=Brevundimonas sp. TaxID=1871086 RepID=UPI002D23175F|nr:helix-turn-helix transcriptional regulator [Brevundimonas sp.]HYD26714.1 helix-turn-helix transcriptional regulator [Brevundimonas sp.]
MIDARPAARLKRYAPGLRQPSHAHDGAHLSLVLAGGFCETDSRGAHAIAAGRTGLRPEGLRHEVRFGAAGAVILTFEPPPRADGRPAVTDPAWSPMLPRAHLRRLTPMLLEDGEAALEAAWDLLALCDTEPVRPRPDPWLRAVHDQLIEAPAGARLTGIAHRAGRHRVHLGRAFLAAYGEPPSVFRRRAMLDRALCLKALGLPAALAAVDAGFADQSHFARACRDVYGLPPGRLMARTAQVAFVQYPDAGPRQSAAAVPETPCAAISSPSCPPFRSSQTPPPPPATRSSRRP